MLAAFATKVPPHIAETVYIKLSISLFRSCVFQGQLSARLILTPAADDDETTARKLLDRGGEESAINIHEISYIGKMVAD